jgi:hypothetical protein
MFGHPIKGFALRGLGWANWHLPPCELFVFHSEDSRVVFRDRLRSALV